MGKNFLVVEFDSLSNGVILEVWKSNTEQEFAKYKKFLEIWNEKMLKFYKKT